MRRRGKQGAGEGGRRLCLIQAGCVEVFTQQTLQLATGDSGLTLISRALRVCVNVCVVGHLQDRFQTKDRLIGDNSSLLETKDLFPIGKKDDFWVSG